MVASAKRSDRPDIARMVRRIVDQFDPDQIILFGSHAHGNPGKDSDVDLLVVLSFSGSARSKAVEIRAALHGLGGSKDIVVTERSVFAWRKDVIGTIEWPAVHQGKVLYVRGR